MHVGWRSEYRIYGRAMQLDLIEGKSRIKLAIEDTYHGQRRTATRMLARTLSRSARPGASTRAIFKTTAGICAANSPQQKAMGNSSTRIVASGVPLLSDEELEQELAERRGGWREED